MDSSQYDTAKTKSQLKRNIKKVLDLTEINIDGNDDTKYLYKDVKLENAQRIVPKKEYKNAKKLQAKPLISPKLSQELNVELHRNQGM